MEDDDQRGVAHFVEHMAFEGTTHFRRHALIDYLESVGLRFGADLNAQTTFDNTTYQLRVPTDKPDVFAKALDVLADWAGGITFDSAGVLTERGVIMEEWRRGLGPSSRIRDQQIPVLYQGSRYATRLPIGLPETVATMTRDKLLRFYHDWYRPDLTAVVAVGDFDPVQVVALIRARFAPLVNPVPERPRTVSTIPDNVAPLISLVSDTEETRAGMTVTYKLPMMSVTTVDGFRQSLAQRMFLAALNQRLADLSRTPDAPFLGAQANFGAMGEATSTFAVSVATRNDGLLAGMRAALVEVERIARFGITDAERARITRAMQSSAENAYAERENVPAAEFAEAYVAEFLGQDSVVVGASEYRTLVAQQLPSVTNADIQRWAALWRMEQNRVVLITLPKAKDALIPDTHSLLAAFGAVQKETLVAHEEQAEVTPLLATLPAPGRIVSTDTLPNGITAWTLSNGVRVLFRQTANTVDKVFFTASSPGGFFQDLRYGFVPAATAAQVVTLGGVGTLSNTELGKQLTGRNVQVSVAIGPYAQGLSGGAALSDLETAFQLIYLGVTQPRIDTTAVSAFRRQFRLSLANNGTPEQAFQDSVTLTLAQHHPLARVMSAAWIDSMDVAQSLAVYRDRFSDVSDLCFVFVGNVTRDVMIPLVERYLASLPGHGRHETPVDPGIHAPKGIVRKTVVGGHEPRTVNLLAFYGPFVMSRTNEWNLYALSKVIELRLTDRLRQQLGGTYAVNVHIAVNPDPAPHYDLTIEFITAPDRAEELTAATLAVLDTLRQRPALDADVQKVRESELLGFASAIESDAFWLSRIAAFAQYHLPFAEITSDAHIRAWRPIDVQTAAQQYLDLTHYARFDLVPAPASAAASASAPAAAP